MKKHKQLTFEEWVKIENRKRFFFSILYAPYNFYRYTKPYPVEYEEIPDYGDVFSFEEFQDCCFEYSFIDSDGCGYYATKDKMTNILANPSDIMIGYIREEFSHVVWFNK